MTQAITGWFKPQLGKRKTTSPRVTSPTGTTSSPDAKNIKSTEPMDVDQDAHSPTPRTVSPQRDKPTQDACSTATKDTPIISPHKPAEIPPVPTLKAPLKSALRKTYADTAKAAAHLPPPTPSTMEEPPSFGDVRYR